MHFEKFLMKKNILLKSFPSLQNFGVNPLFDQCHMVLHDFPLSLHYHLSLPIQPRYLAMVVLMTAIAWPDSEDVPHVSFLFDEQA